MDTKEFLDTVLPARGFRCVGVIHESGAFSNHFGTSNNWLINAATRIDAAGRDAYFACSSFKDKTSRTQANVEAVRSFWLDIDTREGKDGELYANRKEALQHVHRFAAEVGWPAPLAVSSGYGIHCYWPTLEDMDPEEWKYTATLLKAATKEFDLNVDQSRTSDSASILRPPGFSNYKAGQKRTVRVLTRGSPAEHEALRVALEQWLEARGSLPGVVQQRPGESLNSDLMGERNYAPTSAIQLTEQCAVMQEIRDTRGNVEQPLWFHALGLIKYCVEGRELAHEWSKGHPDYTPAETDTVYDRVKGPTRCDTFSNFRKAKCAACPKFGNIASPMSLGKLYSSPQPQASAPVTSEKKFNPDGEHLVGDYYWGPLNGGGGPPVLYRRVITSSDDPDLPPGRDDKFVADVWFKAESRVRSSDDLHSMTIVMRDNQGGDRSFLIDNGLIAGADRGLYAELGRREIGVTNRNKPEIANYLTEWMSRLRDEHAATPSIEQYGWFKDGFVLGKDYITSGGTRRAILNASAHRFEEYFVSAGTLDAWVKAVDRAYNYPGQEALQFCVLLAFAAPLWPLFGENGGVTVYAHSAGSGYGKTTAQQVGLSAWGYYPELVLRESNFTEGALYQHIGVMKNLPVVIDEMTNCSTDFASKLVYNMSAGKGKSRLTSEAVMKKPLNWSTIAAASGNNLLTEKLGLHRANAEAEMARVWEFTVTRRGELGPNEALELFGTFTAHYGLAGRRFIEYVVTHLDEVKAKLLKTRTAFNTRENIQQGERYWSALHSCVLTALDICRDLGLLGFSITKMMDWIGAELRASRVQILGSVSDPLEQFGDMLSDIWSGVLVTLGEGNLAQGAHAQVLGHPRTSITGRSILPDTHSSEKLLISVGAARAWCNKLGVSLKEMHEALVSAGWADKQVKRVSLGKGTEQYSGLGGPVKVWDINPSAVRTVMGTHPIAQKVHRVIVGRGSDDERDGMGSR